MKKTGFFLLSFTSLTQINLTQANFYGGIQIGGGYMKGVHDYTNYDVQTPPSTVPIVYDMTMKGLGMFYGGQLGYLFQPNKKQFFFLELGALLGSANLSKQIGDPSAPVGNVYLNRTVDFFTTAGIGVRLNPKFGVYGCIGIHFQKYNVSYGSLTVGTVPTYTSTPSIISWAPGLGVMYNFTDSLQLRFEYQYALDRKITIKKAGVVNGTNFSTYYRFHEHHVGVLFNYLF